MRHFITAALLSLPLTFAACGGDDGGAPRAGAPVCEGVEFVGCAFAGCHTDTWKLGDTQVVYVDAKTEAHVTLSTGAVEVRVDGLQVAQACQVGNLQALQSTATSH